MGFESLYTAGLYLFAFVAMLGVLISVHEFGHFIVAKLCGVRVLKFSLGFGPPIGFGRMSLRWVRGHTEYVVCWIPLGGFVKMLGDSQFEDDEDVVDADPSETLASKPLWQKLAVVFAGPAMNLLLPVAIFATILGVGLPQANSTLGEVEPGSPAAEAGLRPGDRIVAVDGAPIGWWRELDQALVEHTEGPLSLRYERDGSETGVSIGVESRARPDVFGEDETVGWLGVHHRRPRAMIGVADAISPAYRVGLRSGDLVSEVAGDAVEDWYGFVDRYAALPGGEAVLVIRRGPEAGETVEITIPALGSAAALGVIRADVLITAVSEDSPAAAAGLAAGDLILSVDGSPMTSFDSFAEVVRTSEGRALDLVVARDGERIAAAVAPEIVQTDLTGMGIEVPRYRIGIVGNNLLAVVGGISTDQVINPFESIPRSFEMTVEITRLFLRGLGKLFTGEVSRDQLSGPIGIAEIAGKSLERGWMEYLQTLILISINLGILNLLPIPILDGGQALVFLVEGVRRAPLSLRTREFVQQVGVTMLILIMGFAFWNDISRNWSRVVDWLTGGL